MYQVDHANKYLICSTIFHCHHAYTSIYILPCQCLNTLQTYQHLLSTSPKISDKHWISESLTVKMAAGDDSSVAETARNPNQVKREFLRILKKIESQGLSFGKVKDLKSVRRLKREENGRKWKMYFYLYISLTATVWGLFFFNGLHTVEGMTKFFMGVSDLESEEVTLEQCLVEMPEPLTDMFRPMTDCSMCRGVSSVSKLSRVSVEDFEKK